jgi:hypothetical protein
MAGADGSRALSVIAKRLDAAGCEQRPEVRRRFDHGVDLLGAQILHRRSVAAIGHELEPGSCAGDAQSSGGASDVLDDDGLPQNGPHPFTEEPRQRIGRGRPPETARSW